MRCDRCGHRGKQRARFCSACGSELAINLVGEVLGERYRVLSFIGSGGMGRVYRAEHMLLEKPVAVKVLAPEYARDEGMWRRFRREAFAASRVAHPNIASVLDFAYEDDLVYSVMEYVDGTPLDALIAHRPMILPRALDIAHQIALALGAAHDAGVIHRDVKPGNVIVSELGRRDFVKVVDFGLAVLRSHVGKARSSQGGPTMGTPAYVAPELVLGEPLDARTDIYALGSVLYEMIVGQPPFGHGDPAQLSVSHAYKTPVSPSEHAHIFNLPEDVDDLIMQMLAKNPDHRPADGNAVAEALARVLSLISSPVPMLSQVTCAILVVRFRDSDTVTEQRRRDATAVIVDRGGHMARLPGDELIAYFSGADEALRAAARLQRLSQDLPLAVSVHHGSVEISAGGAVLGHTVNIALRMARLAEDGDALVSGEIRQILEPGLQACLREPARMRVGDRWLDAYQVGEITPDGELPVIEGLVRGQSAVEFTCLCGAQGVIVTGKLRAAETIRARCRGCARQLLVTPRVEAELAEDLEVEIHVEEDEPVSRSVSAHTTAEIHMDESPTEDDLPRADSPALARHISEVE